MIIATTRSKLDVAFLSDFSFFFPFLFLHFSIDKKSVYRMQRACVCMSEEERRKDKKREKEKWRNLIKKRKEKKNIRILKRVKDIIIKCTRYTNFL